MTAVSKTAVRMSAERTMAENDSRQNDSIKDTTERMMLESDGEEGKKAERIIAERRTQQRE